MRNVTIYSTDNCPFCIRTKQLLDTRGVQYDEVNLERDPHGRQELVERTGMMTFPQVLVGDELIGGFTETLAADRSGRLKALLAEAA